MPSGPRKRKAARRKTEAAKGQEQQQPHDKDTERDGSLCGSFEEQDDYLSSPSPRLQDNSCRISSSEEKDEILNNTEEWVRVSNDDAGPSQHKNESQIAGSEDPGVISPNTSRPYDRLVDWETISNSSFVDHQEDNQCANPNESKSNSKLSAGSTDQLILDACASKPFGDSCREVQCDSPNNTEIDSKATEEGCVGVNDFSNEVTETASPAEDNFDSVYKCTTTPSINVDETMLKQLIDIKFVRENVSKLDSEDVCNKHILDNNKETTAVIVSDEHRNVDSLVPGLITTVPNGKFAVTPLGRENTEQDICSTPELVDDTGDKEAIAVTTEDETDPSKVCIMGVEVSSREDKESSSISPESADTVDVEAWPVSAHDDARKKSFEKESILEVLEDLGMDVENSLIVSRSTDLQNLKKESLAKVEVCSEVITNQSESLEDGILVAGKDTSFEKTSYSDPEDFTQSLSVLSVSVEANGDKEAHSQHVEANGDKEAHSQHVEANEDKETHSQPLEQCKVANPSPYVSEQLKTRNHLGDDNSNDALGIQDSHKNQVVPGTGNHKKLATWKDCCGVFDWLFSGSH